MFGSTTTGNAAVAVNTAVIAPLRTSAPRTIEGVIYETSIFKIGDLAALANKDFENGTYKTVGMGVSFAALKGILGLGDKVGGTFIFNGEIKRTTQKTKEGKEQNSYTAFGMLKVGDKTLNGQLTLSGYYDKNGGLNPSPKEFTEAFANWKIGEEVPVFACYMSDLPNGAPYIPAHYTL